MNLKNILLSILCVCLFCGIKGIDPVEEKKLEELFKKTFQREREITDKSLELLTKHGKKLKDPAIQEIILKVTTSYREMINSIESAQYNDEQKLSSLWLILPNFYELFLLFVEDWEEEEMLNADGTEKEFILPQELYIRLGQLALINKKAKKYCTAVKLNGFL